MKQEGDGTERQVINRHLYRRHGGLKATGTTMDRLLLHEELHRKRCDHEHADMLKPGAYTVDDGNDA